MTTLLRPDRATTLHEGAVDASPPPGARERLRVRVDSSQALLGIALLLGWFLLYLTVLSGLEQGHAQARLYQQLRSDLAGGTAPTGAPIATGAPVALLSVPEAGIDDLVVVEGSRPEQLQDGPGHVLGSVLPGQQGVSVVAGRSLSFGAPFAGIPDLVPGDLITATAAQGTFHYVVDSVRTAGDPVPAALPQGAGRLTLVTAGRGSGLGGLSASQTVYVDATLASGAAVAGPVATKDPGAALMAGTHDTATLAMLVLSLQVLLAVLAGFAWAWHTWSPRATWIAGAPCVVAALWLVSSLASRLLPGLV